MRYARWSLLGGLIAFLVAAPAAGATPDAPPHDANSWALLIAEAKKHGGAETRLDKSSSYVFQQQDGNFLTLTEWRAPPKRFVCVIAKDQKATVCVNWETGRTTYGERADAASPWKTHEATALEETGETTPQAQFLGKIGEFFGAALGVKSRSVKPSSKP